MKKTNTSKMADLDPIEIDDVDLEEAYLEQLGIEGLNQDDYTLNSPLILDYSQYAFQYIFLNVDPPSYLRKSYWKDLKTNFQKFFPVPLIPLEPIKNHKIWGRLSQSRNIKVKEIQDFINQINDDVKITSSVLDAFLKGWLGHGTAAPTKEIRDSFILRYGQLFLESYKIILIMNAKNKEEYKNLQNQFNFSGEYHTKFTTTSLFTTTNLGEVVIGGGFAWFKQFRIFMDRNFLLMIKDTWLARFNTMLSLLGRQDNLYPRGCQEVVENFYKIGDEMLIEGGNDAFSSIKLLEPLCLNRLEEIAKLKKPLLPPFTRFSKHIKKTIDELNFGKHHVTQWKLLLNSFENVDFILLIYGAFRHWGHPYINYLEGLEKLHRQVNLIKNIDVKYANQLASDLAKIVLTTQFKEKKMWMVDQTELEKSHPLYNHIKNNTWPTGGEIEDIGDVWNTLPIKKCFDIPDFLEPSIIYSDKSHSMDRSEVINHIKNKKEGPIPTKKVLITLLESKETNWKELLERIDKEGLSDEELVIGLKVKERELKPEGRFFSLMSWVLREYFVITEYLIKKYFVPLFKGLTMADDLTELMKKMLDSSSGQGEEFLEEISIANHVDYEKWNNHQRAESTNPVFQVMDKCLGFKRLISRTHEFFQKSLIYYNERPDLMIIRNGFLENKGDQRVMWMGQLGGLEGLRQKGWTILGMLSINRESKIRNTKIRVLAQGDNQVVCTKYKLPPTKNEYEVRECLKNVSTNNNVILDAIIEGSKKLGLIINKDETIQSADLLVYGKIPIIFGCLRGLESKRYSRISCTTNDQIPSLANVMSTVNTACLTVSHQSSSPVEPMRQHCFFGNMVRKLIEIHDPVLQDSIKKVLPIISGEVEALFKMSCLYIDPSLGGICGTSLNRFLIRMFPDPITESLSFWKNVLKNTQNPLVIKLANYAGNPEIESFNLTQLDKLLEDPLSLNLKKGISINFILKQEIKKELESNVGTIKNQVIKSAIAYSVSQESVLRTFLFSIQPLFPRFISEFRSSTYFGIVDSITGLIVNSVTIRKLFHKKMKKELDVKMYNAERNSIKHMCIGLKYTTQVKRNWKCSSSHADKLRKQSWGQVVLGGTVPHPSELLGHGREARRTCKDCNGDSSDDYVTTTVPNGMINYLETRGKYPSYLGSKTQESTNILQPWEKESKIPLLERGLHLRSAINWFVESGSNLAVSILGILQGLTGENWGEGQVGFKRTGSALHRFTASRQSTGGYVASSPAKLSRMITTTDTLTAIGDTNYDFMFQSLILFAQISVGELSDGNPSPLIYHHHIECIECLRPIEEPILDSPRVYLHPDVHNELIKWLPPGIGFSISIPSFPIKKGQWSKVGLEEGVFHIGRTIGFLFGDSIYCPKSGFESNSLFPISLGKLTFLRSFFSGLLDGILRAVSLNILHRRGSGDFTNLGRVFRGGVFFLIRKLACDSNAQALLRNQGAVSLMTKASHRVPPSYPVKQDELGILIKSFLEHMFSNDEKFYGIGYKTPYMKLWIFSDVYVSQMTGLFLLSSRCLKFTTVSRFQKQTEKTLGQLKSLIQELRGQENITTQLGKSKAFLCDHETRSAGKELLRRFENEIKEIPPRHLLWKEKKNGQIIKVEISYRSLGDETHKPIWNIPKRESPLISGLRVVQLATGAHYKLRSLLSNHPLIYRDFICGGDGSGGLTSFLLRWRQNSRGLFNSLLDYTGVNMKGSHPTGPSAVGVDDDLQDRCLNYHYAWKVPSDLSTKECWSYFLREKDKYDLKLDLIVLDMESRTTLMSINIEDRLKENLHKLLELNGSIIYKTYLSYLSNNVTNIIEKIGKYFFKTFVCQTSFTSMYSSEVYVIFCQLKSEGSVLSNIFWKKLITDTRDFYCFANQQKEFLRARSVPIFEVISMIPHSLIPELQFELTSLWEKCGIPLGVASDLAYNASILNADELPEYFLSVSLIALNFCYSFTKNFSHPPPLPSDPALMHFGALLAGTLMWLGWSSGNRAIYNQGERLFAKEVPFFFSYEAIQIKNLNKSHLSKMNRFIGKWSTIPSGINKTVRISHLGGLIGSFIRVYTRSLHITNIGKLSYSKIYKFAQLNNKYINSEKVTNQTGFIELISREDIFESVHPRYEVFEVEGAESAWRD